MQWLVVLTLPRLQGMSHHKLRTSSSLEMVMEALAAGGKQSNFICLYFCQYSNTFSLLLSPLQVHKIIQFFSCAPVSNLLKGFCLHFCLWHFAPTIP